MPYTSVAGVAVILDTVLHGQVQHAIQCSMGSCKLATRKSVLHGYLQHIFYAVRAVIAAADSQSMAIGRRLTYPQTCTRSFRSTRQARHTTNSPPHCRRWNESQRHTCTRHVIPPRKSCLRVSGLCVEWSVDLDRLLLQKSNDQTECIATCMYE